MESLLQGLRWWLSDKESACQCRRCGFNCWVGKIPWRRKWQPTPILLPGKSHGLCLTRLLQQWNFPGKSTGVGCHFLLQGIFPTQGLNLGLLHLQVDTLPSGPPGKPRSQVYTPQLIMCLRPHQVYIKTSLPRSGSL